MMEMKSTVGTTVAASSFSLPRLCSLALMIFNIVATPSLFLPHHHATAQSNQPSSPRTDPIEVEALNSIFRKWNISSTMSNLPWNHTGNGDPCTGNAIPADDKIRDDYERFNPSILCDCNNNNGSTCHIIRLTAYKLNITGTIPDELSKLSRLENLNIGRNALSGAIPKELGNLQNLIFLCMGMNNFSGSLPAELGNLKSLEKMQVFTKKRIAYHATQHSMINP